MAEEFDDLDLNSLNDEELTEQVHDDLYNGLREEVIEATNIMLGRGWSASRVLDDALVEGMRIVGVDFRDGILFVPEVLLAANAMKGGMEILRPLLAETGVEPASTVMVGDTTYDMELARSAGCRAIGRHHRDRRNDVMPSPRQQFEHPALRAGVRRRAEDAPPGCDRGIARQHDFTSAPRHRPRLRQKPCLFDQRPDPGGQHAGA